MAHNPSSIMEIRENVNAPMKRELLVVRRAFALGSTSRMKPHESSRFRVLINQNPSFKRSPIAVEMLQKAHKI
jgi:hypothetical protein